MSLDLSLLPDGGVSWLDASGEHSDIVLSTRIRLARNVEGFAFTSRARDGERLRVLAQVRDAVRKVPVLADNLLFRVDELTPTERLLQFVLVDRVRGEYLGGLDIDAIEALGVEVIDTPLVSDETAPLIESRRLVELLLSLV